jgi:hypothetical protein
MLVHNSFLIKIVKLTAFWLCVACVFFLFGFLIKYELKPTRKPVAIEIDINNKVNICIPEENYEK